MLNEVSLRENGKKRVKTLILGASLTQQHHKQICDVNHIVRRYRKTGLIDHVNSVRGAYGDFSEVGSYHECMNKLIAADDAFMRLPSEVRKEFDNDPGIMLNELGKPENFDRMVELGLLAPKEQVSSVVESPSSEVGIDSAQ